MNDLTVDLLVGGRKWKAWTREGTGRAETIAAFAVLRLAVPDAS